MSDPIKRIDELMRGSYRTQMDSSNNQVINELKEIKEQLKIANEKVDKEKEKASEYDDWRVVHTDEENRQHALVFKNLRRLNIV